MPGDYPTGTMVDYFEDKLFDEVDNEERQAMAVVRDDGFQKPVSDIGPTCLFIFIWLRCPDCNQTLVWSRVHRN